MGSSTTVGRLAPPLRMLDGCLPSSHDFHDTRQLVAVKHPILGSSTTFGRRAPGSEAFYSVWPLSTTIEAALLARCHIAPMAHRARLVNVSGELGEETMTKMNEILKVVRSWTHDVPRAFARAAATRGACRASTTHSERARSTPAARRASPGASRVAVPRWSIGIAPLLARHHVKIT
jgi:hypothetical protein